MACTTILVGKGASYDGSTIIARNEDDEPGSFNNKKLIIVRPEDQPCTYTSVNGHLTIDLPSDPLQYSETPNSFTSAGVWGEAGINEANVAMTATETITSNARVLGADPLVPYTPAKGTEGSADYEPAVPGGIGEEDLVTIVLPYIHSAREGVERLGALLEEYGTYESNGVAFSDANEIWWFESVGGHHWIAKRVPDDCYVTMPNQLGIDEFDLDDAFGAQQDCMCSADLREFIARNHLDLSVEGLSAFDPRSAFGSHSDADHVYNTPRAWYMQRYFNPYDEVWDGPDADHKPTGDDIPWARQPERKITVEDIKYVLSSHYQGTEYDPYGTLGTEATRHLFRPIGINRQNHLAVMQIRPYRPQVNRAVQWLTYASNPFNALVPFFPNVDDTPAYLRDTTTRVTTENMYWENRIIAALCDAQFAETSAAVERFQQKMGALGNRIVAAADARVDELVGADAQAEEKLDEQYEVDDISEDIEPMEPADIIAAVRNADVRAALEQANDEMAAQLKDGTDDLLNSVLYTVSMKMRNGYNRSDN